MKKLFIVLATVFIFSTAVVASSGGLSDLADCGEGGPWYCGAAYFAQYHNFINGINGKFAPGKPVTRDQAAVMFQKFAANVHIQQGKRIFSDGWLNFKLTFPDTWRGYLYEAQYKPQGDMVRSLVHYEFGLLNFRNSFEALFFLSVWDKETWKAHGPNEIEKGNVIGENNSYVVVLTPSLAGEFSKELEAAYADLEQIRNSFAWIP